MTNKAEDKFYFQQSKFVVCVLFGDRCVFQNAYATLSQAQSEAKKAHAKYGHVGNEYLPTAKGTVEIREYQGSNLISQHKFSRPGQPERFAEMNVIDKLMRLAMREGMSEKMRPEVDRILGVGSFDKLFQSYKAALGSSKIIELQRQGKSVPEAWDAYFGPGSWKKFTDNLYSQLRSNIRASRPGQPEKFDASSLDRGSFAEASTSPMLGKLLAAKVMPEGGWRAVQVGSDTLVISFEDADLARDFGRRAATKGYNATSPVQAIGRYWNVEVKNGN